MGQLVDTEKYYPILRESIRLGIAVPFDCFLYLKANGKMLQFIRQNDIPVDKTLERLRQKSIDRIYIQTDDLSKYRNYLEFFLDSTEGQKFLKDINGVKTVPEIPDDLLKEYLNRKKEVEEYFKLGSLFNGLGHEFAEEEKIQIKEALQNINQELSKVFSAKDSTGSLKVINPLKENNSSIKIEDDQNMVTSLKEVVKELKDQIDHHGKKAKAIKEDDLEKIQEKIQSVFKDEILKVKSNPEVLDKETDTDIQKRIEGKINNLLRDEGLQKGVDLLSSMRPQIKRTMQKIRKDYFVIKGNYGDYSNQEEELGTPSNPSNSHSTPQKKHGRVKVVEEIQSRNNHPIPTESETKIYKQLQALKKIAKSGVGNLHIQLLNRIDRFENNLNESKQVVETEGGDQFFINRELFEKEEQEVVDYFSKNKEQQIPPGFAQFLGHFKSLFESSPELKELMLSGEEIPSEKIGQLQHLAHSFGQIIGHHLEQGAIPLPPGTTIPQQIQPNESTQEIKQIIPVDKKESLEDKVVIDAEDAEELKGPKKKTLMQIIAKQKIELKNQSQGSSHNVGNNIQNNNYDEDVNLLRSEPMDTEEALKRNPIEKITQSTKEGGKKGDELEQILEELNQDVVEEFSENEGEDEGENIRIGKNNTSSSPRHKNRTIQPLKDFLLSAPEEIEGEDEIEEDSVSNSSSPSRHKNKTFHPPKDFSHDKLSELQIKMIDLEQEKNDLQKQKDKIENNLKKIEYDVARLNELNQNLRSEKEKIQETHLKEKQDLIKKISEEKEKYEKELENQKIALQKKWEEKKSFSQPSETTTIPNKGESSSNSNNEKGLSSGDTSSENSDELDNELLEQSLDRAKHLEEIEVKKDQFDNVVEEKINLENENKIKDSEAKEYKSTISELQQQLLSKEKIIEDLTTSLQKLENGSGMTENVKERLSTTIAEQTKQISKLTNSIEQQKETVRNLNKEIMMLKNKNEEVMRLKKKLTDKMAGVEEQKKLFKKSEEALNTKVATLTNMYNESRKAVAKMMATNDEMRKEKTKAIAQATEFENIKSQLNKNIGRLQQAQTQQEQAIKKMQKENQRLMEKNKELQAQYAQETQKVHELQKKLKK